MARINRIISEFIIRPIKKPVWYAVHSLTGIRMQMTTRILDGSMFSASFRVPFNKAKKLMPSPKISPIEYSPGFAEIIIQANEFRHIDILYPYNEVAVAIPISYHIGSKNSISSGLWYLHLPVSTEDARWGGVENYGFPKFVAEIEFDSNINTQQCTVTHNGGNILTIKAKTIDTQFQEWKYDNITMNDGRLLHSSLSVKGQKGIDETVGGAIISFGDHPIAEELQSLEMGFTSFRHAYMPKIQAILSIAHEIKEL